jgi:type I restriction enzyme M protein
MKNSGRRRSATPAPRVRASTKITGGKPTETPTTPHKPGEPLEPLVVGSWIWCPLKSDWRVAIPEELVRQRYVLVLWHRYGYSFEQMDQERRVKHGRRSPKADIVVWRSEEEKRGNLSPLIVVECKSDNVTINPEDYEQGDSYARATACEFLVTHNAKETRPFRITPGVPGNREDIEDVPRFADLADTRRMEAIRRATKAFTREEFRRLLSDCHNILRDNHKLDPGRAFDEISKILFIKMFHERTGSHEKFTVDFLDKYAQLRRRKLEEVMNDLFDDTKEYYKADQLFGADDQLNISFATFKRIVGKLQRFNLAATSDDVKGIAFERFLGQTFRGELGQFFTPRPIVDFMVELLDPGETDVLCDPASGSGGFLIKFFEYVRSKVETEIKLEKAKIRAAVDRSTDDEEKRTERLNNAYTVLNEELEVTRAGSRLSKVADERIFGTDAEVRAARTSKMNMIMHGDGHGGIHHHDGLIDVNGIFAGRFDLVLTNPPFGSKVGDDQIVGDTPETRVSTNPETRKIYSRRFGSKYDQSYDAMLSAEKNRETVLSRFELGRDQQKVKTEILYLERCLDLLKPGGRLGIVVPDGVLNNPSLEYLREHVESRSELLGVVSIPDKTFRSAKTAVKASILFLRKLTERELAARAATRSRAAAALQSSVGRRLEALEAAATVSWQEYRRAVESATSRRPSTNAAVVLWGDALDRSSFRANQKQAKAEAQEQRTLVDAKIRQAIREKHDYPIFMAVADHVGIRGSGKVDPENELPTITAAWKRFAKSHRSIYPDVRAKVFRVQWSAVDRWDPSSFRPIEWECRPDLLRPLGSVVKQRVEPVARDGIDFSDLTPITIHFDGSVEARDMSDTDDYTMDLFHAKADDIVVSKIDLKNGAVGIVPRELPNVVVTNHFVVYEPDETQLYPPYLIRLIQAPFFKDYLWRKKVGSEGRKEVKISLFESIKIPLPSTDEQKKLLAEWDSLDAERQRLRQKMDVVGKRLELDLIRGSSRV